jgi:hypothetical protein
VLCCAVLCCAVLCCAVILACSSLTACATSSSSSSSSTRLREAHRGAPLLAGHHKARGLQVQGGHAAASPHQNIISKALRCCAEWLQVLACKSCSFRLRCAVCLSMWGCFALATSSACRHGLWGRCCVAMICNAITTPLVAGMGSACRHGCRTHVATCLRCM